MKHVEWKCSGTGCSTVVRNSHDLPDGWLLLTQQRCVEGQIRVSEQHFCCIDCLYSWSGTAKKVRRALLLKRKNANYPGNVFQDIATGLSIV